MQHEKKKTAKSTKVQNGATTQHLHGGNNAAISSFYTGGKANLHDKLAEKKSLRTIAIEMGRHVSSIARELSRNRNKDGTYNAWRGSVLYILRRRKSRRRYLLNKNPELYQWIANCLAKYWPPEAIVVRWKIKHPKARLSHTTIYLAIKAGRLPGISGKTHLRRHGRRRKCHNTTTIHPEHCICDRPKEANARERIGDWEGDTVHGAVGKGGVATCVDRRSKYLIASLLHDFTSGHVNQALKSALENLPVHTITLDNGSEFAEFKKLEETLQTTNYFADPHSPWQRGTNETRMVCSVSSSQRELTSTL